MSAVQYIVSDAGRKDSGIAERRDCTVVALAHATGIPYEICHKALAKHGRKNKRGVVFRRIAQKVAREVGFEFKPVRRSGTIRKFVQDFPKGTFYVLIRGHAFTVKDGSVMDSFQTPSGSIVKIAWQVLPQGSTVPKRKSLHGEHLTIAKVNKAIAEFDLTLVKDEDSYGPLFYFIETSSQMHINETVLASRLNGFSLSQWVARAGLARARYNLLLAERYGLGWH